VTGERVVVRIGTDETGGELLVVDLDIRPGGAGPGVVSGEPGGESGIGCAN
jgi:hypothetical protein